MSDAVASGVAGITVNDVLQQPQGANENTGQDQ